MTRTAWMFFCIPLVMTLGCHSTRTREMATEPNAVQGQASTSIDSQVSGTEPNTPSSPKLCVLSGSLGTGHATLRGLPGDPNALANGTYSVTVDTGWSGTVIPEKEGFLFSPASRSYEPFTRDIHHEIYIPRAVSASHCPKDLEGSDSRSQSLTGVLELGGVPIQGIILRTLATSMAAITDANGLFSLAVPSDWRGTLRLQAPNPSQDAPAREAPLGECTSKGMLNNTARATEIAPVKVQAKKEPPTDEPLITLGTPSLPTEAMNELTQDLKVMCRLLSEAAFGISLVKRDPNSEPQAIYLAGDGVLFNICIDWPLAGPLPEPSAPEQSAKWKTAREYIQHRSAPAGPQETLHRMKTLAFIQKMTHCLANASNIRHLADDNHITLHIWGSPPSENLVIRATVKTIRDYAKAALTGDTFETQVDLKLH